MAYEIDWSQTARTDRVESFVGTLEGYRPKCASPRHNRSITVARIGEELNIPKYNDGLCTMSHIRIKFSQREWIDGWVQQ